MGILVRGAIFFACAAQGKEEKQGIDFAEKCEDLADELKDAKSAKASAVKGLKAAEKKIAELEAEVESLKAAEKKKEAEVEKLTAAAKAAPPPSSSDGSFVNMAPLRKLYSVGSSQISKQVKYEDIKETVSSQVGIFTKVAVLVYQDLYEGVSDFYTTASTVWNGWYASSIKPMYFEVEKEALKFYADNVAEHIEEPVVKPARQLYEDLKVDDLVVQGKAALSEGYDMATATAVDLYTFGSNQVGPLAKEMMQKGWETGAGADLSDMYSVAGGAMGNIPMPNGNELDFLYAPITVPLIEGEKVTFDRGVWDIVTSLFVFLIGSYIFYYVVVKFLIYNFLLYFVGYTILYGSSSMVIGLTWSIFTGVLYLMYSIVWYALMAVMCCGCCGLCCRRKAPAASPVPVTKATRPKPAANGTTNKAANKENKQDASNVTKKANSPKGATNGKIDTKKKK